MYLPICAKNSKQTVVKEIITSILSKRTKLTVAGTAQALKITVFSFLKKLKTPFRTYFPFNLSTHVLR